MQKLLFDSAHNMDTMFSDINDNIFYLQCYPNGDNQSVLGYVSLCIKYKMMPCGKINQSKMQLIESPMNNVKRTFMHSFSTNESFTGRGYKKFFKRNESILKNMSSIKFIADIEEECYDHSGQIINGIQFKNDLDDNKDDDLNGMFYI